MTTTPLTIYGIPNCDTVKKARAWLQEQGLEAVFHDFKKQGVPAAELERWVTALGWERLINRQGTTWRKLPPEQQAAVRDAASAQALAMAQPSVIKRPVVAWPGPAGTVFTVGFSPANWTDRGQALRQG